MAPNRASRNDDAGAAVTLPRPRASVVVPTRNRCRALERLIQALEAQTLPSADFEVIVTDDGSGDDTPQLLERRATRDGCRFRFARSPEPRGPAAARNVGWRLARAPIVAFTDDDCVPDLRWLESGLACFGENIGIVVGRTSPRGRPDAPQFTRTMDVGGEDWHYPTCNAFYLREALERVGGFDESFQYACGEDTDLAWRVKKAGYGSRFAADAVVVHEVRPPSFYLFLKERRRFADQVLLVKRHPELRRFYYRRYFYRRSHVHALATVALFGVAAYSATALLLLPAVWLDRLRRSDLGREWTTRVTTSLELIVADWWELAVFSYASLRYRSLLL